ncbi:helix-turn-helix domain-containing protein [Streptomyces sp. RM72]|uniref:helix-turn-helix transcriptional regulator n=1 Tax=Streptomyces sp. RM72 TaxID=1115510 RepID=UPI001B37CCC9|nr:helix-turn-helix transcriptional regulator [Streptomyces sp. RM72]MBQ0887040.1 helix-turn-helix domain-containing protein [Streptomyces sp. RM72]
MSSGARPGELGAFLRARRAGLSPRTVGLPDTGRRRRVTGLRREEVAELAEISTAQYTRLEQGRIRPSAPVLDALARVLHLDDEQRAHMFDLAGHAADSGRPVRRPAQQARPRLLRVLHDLNRSPAMILGRRMDILAWNSLAAALITEFSEIPEKDRNFLRLLFTDPAMRELYADWEGIARAGVARLCSEAARDPDDARLLALVGQLSVRDPDFRTWWATRHGAVHGAGVQRLHHPIVGELTLDWDTLVPATGADQRLVVWSAESGTQAHDKLLILASWGRTPRE